MQIVYDSSEDSCILSEVLQETTLIGKMEIPSKLIELITEFGRGDIIICWKCEKEDHVDGVIDLEKELDEREDWEFDDDDVICSTCHNELQCTLCYESVEEGNFKCDECENVVCSECDFDRHFEQHIDLELDPPQSYYDSIQFGGEPLLFF